MERIDPLFSKPIVAPTENKVTAARDDHHLVAAGESPPLSPISNTPMVLAEVGLAGDRRILAWVSIEDRITLPVRKA